MFTRFRTVLALVAAFVGLLALSVPHASALGDDWQALQVQIVGQGSVTGSGGYSCPDDYTDPNQCSKAYDYGSVVNLNAAPASGWMFAGWQGCDSVAGAICQVILDVPGGGNTSITASFTKFQPSPTQYPLTVSVDGPGTVTGSGIDCPGDCAQSVIAGAWVTLLAYPGPLAAFTGWSGACSGGPQSACVVKMDAARTVTARFAADIPIGQPRTLTVGIAGTGTGSVTSGSAIVCPGDCSQTYTVDAQVQLVATPAAGSVFAGWSGGCSGSSSSCGLTVRSSRTVTATFEKAPVDQGNPGADPAPSQPGSPVPGGPEAACSITGTPGSDVLVGTAGSDVICGLGGNDRLIGKGGLDLLVGGNGADRLLGGAGNDLLLGGAGRDRLGGGAGKDRLVGGSGNDRITGGPGADRLAGGRGLDLLLARDGARDRLDGGRGRDRARVDRSDVTRRIEARA